MHSQMQGLKVAILVANGFDEAPYIEMQRVWKNSGAELSLVSANPGLVNSWRDGDWGLNYLTDHHLSSALAADFDVMMVFGGRKGIDKLMTTAHTKRFINGFMDSAKPVMMMDEAMELYAFAGRDGHAMATEVGHTQDGMVFTAMSSADMMAEIMQAGHDFVMSHMSMQQAA